MFVKIANSLSQTARLVKLPHFWESSINEPPVKYAENRQALKENTWRDVDVTHTKSQKTHLSNGQQLIHQIPIIKSHGEVIRCIGGSMPGAGHPQVYIQLNTQNPGEAVPCKYCGLLYALEGHYH